MTKGELLWLEFIAGKYSIANYLYNNLVDGVVTIYDNFSGVLDLDWDCVGKAVCLDDDSALQAIFFYNYNEPE